MRSYLFAFFAGFAREKNMSKHAINHYYSKIDQYRRFGGTQNETSLRRAFANLLEEYCAPKNLIPVDEAALKNSRKRPDGTVKDALRLDWGHWESKDPGDNLDAEIEKKFSIGYPNFNIIFENSQEIVLFQQGSRIMHCDMRNPDSLDALLNAFVSYERPEIRDFHLAVEKFRADIPDIIEALRAMISRELKTNRAFRQANAEFEDICKESINPEISAFDIKEMLIQHILTAEIFDTVFGESHFHRENNIAKELEAVVGTFFTGAVRRNTLAGIDSYYKAIKAEAARIDNHHEKQKFLKVIYENFYKAYNPKGADRLGIVYTPGEIVRFMIESTDWLLEKHFGKSLSDRNVEILDPATGTGTFVTEMIEYIPPQYLEYKYKNEIHANEVAILPYYIASLNIEYTYQQKMGKYEPFENIVFVDTLDNTGFDFKGQTTLAGFGMNAENLARIQKQNERKISVIIGNPPYNAKQQLYNDFNPNRKYKKIDERIRETYIREGTAQNQIVVYDMYTRFLRWASDRIHKNGIIAFITNRSYIDSRAFDGFRKTIAEEFDKIYIVDTQSDVRKNPKIAGTTHNVFGIQTGVAVIFLVKSSESKKGKAGIHYFTLTDEMLKHEKSDWFRDNKLADIAFESITPDKDGNWLNITDNDFDEFIPLIDKDVKAGKGEKAVFRYFSRGLESNRQDWVYDYDKENLVKKTKHTVSIYNRDKKNKQLSDEIKWSRELKKHLSKNGSTILYNEKSVTEAFLKPYCKNYLYLDKYLNSYVYEWETYTHSKFYEIFIAIPGLSSPANFHCLGIDKVIDLNALPAGVQCLPLYRYDKDGSRNDNITDWALRQFAEHYQDDSIGKEDIFHYTYAVLHNPAYRRKYETNLKREFPRVPFYRDFHKWAKWGRTLTDLHINYESAEPYPLKRIETAQKDAPKAKLRAVPEKGEIILDDNTTLSGVPAKAWDYTLGNRSALHWILDQYKEKTPKDKTIAEKFNTYIFSDYKEPVIDLLKRVCTVSVKTVDIVNKMTEEEPHE